MNQYSQDLDNFNNLPEETKTKYRDEFEAYDTKRGVVWIQNKKVWSDMTEEAQNYWGAFYGNLKDKVKRIVGFYDRFRQD